MLRWFELFATRNKDGRIKAHVLTPLMVNLETGELMIRNGKYVQTLGVTLGVLAPKSNKDAV